MNNKYSQRMVKGFLKVNNLEIKEGLYRAVNEPTECLRCSVIENASTIGANLIHFVCDYCRLDLQDWDYAKRQDGISYTIQSMVNEQPDKYYTDHQSGEGRN